MRERTLLHRFYRWQIDKQKEGKCLFDVPIVCKGDTLLKAVSHYKPDQIIIAMRKSRYEKILKDLIYLSQEGIEIRDITSIYEEIAGKIPLKYVSDTWILYSHINKSKIYFYRLKRLVDIGLMRPTGRGRARKYIFASPTEQE